MSNYTKLLEDTLKQVADLKKSVEAKGAAASAEQLEKQVNDIVQKRMEANKSEVRKGEYRPSQNDMPGSGILFEKSDDPKIKDFQKWNDSVVLCSTLMKTHPANLDVFRKRADKYSDMRKAMDSVTAAEGLEWVPTEFSSDLYDRVHLALKVAGLFAQINMPSDPYKLPVVSADSSAYLVAENTADSAQTGPTASTPGTRNVTLNASKLGARVFFSEELREDSIIPIVDFIKNNMAQNVARSIEDAILNGDTTATHMDSDVTSSSDVRKAWKGLRKLAQSANNVNLGTLSTANLRSMRGAMGRYGVDPNKLAWICSAKGYMKLLSLAEVITVDKYGPNATILSGELAKLDGIPVIVSEKMRDDLNASGVNDSTTNTKGAILLCYTDAFVLGNRRKLTLKSFLDVSFDQTALVTTWRGDFEAIHDETTNPIVSVGYNLTV